MTRRSLDASPRPLTDSYDTALLDLDGVVYRGPHAVPHAKAALDAARARGMRMAFVTNNAARPPADVAAHLVELGVPADPADVVTSAQAAARMAAERVPPGAPVLVIGGAGLEVALRERGLVPVWSADDAPAAVVQGYSPDIDWHQLAEGAYAIARGVPWIASNLDTTLPTARGLAPGNGAMVAALRAATGAEPMAAGKPQLPLHRETIIRTGADHPLVVGDRLDTDVEGANNAGVDSLLVLTGVATPAQLLTAPPLLRPTYVAADLRGLLVPHPSVDAASIAGVDGFRCGRWFAGVHDGVADLAALDGTAGVPIDETAGEPMDALRALCAACWAEAEPPAVEKALDVVERRLDQLRESAQLEERP